MIFNMLYNLGYNLKNILSKRSQKYCLIGFMTRDKPNQLASISIAIDPILPLTLNRGQHTQIAVSLLLELQGVPILSAMLRGISLLSCKVIIQSHYSRNQQATAVSLLAGFPGRRILFALMFYFIPNLIAA